MDRIDEAIGIGNTHGEVADKFEHFRLTAEPGQAVAAPRVVECPAHFEWRLVDDRLVDGQNFVVFEVVRSNVAPVPAYPKTLYYTGDGVLRVAGQTIEFSEQFLP